MELACQPVHLIAHQLIAGLDLTSCSTWERAVFRNGAHRWALAQQFVPNARGVIVERVQDFDESVCVGNVVAFTDWNPNEPDVVGPTLALARLAAVRYGFSTKAQTTRSSTGRPLNAPGRSAWLSVHRAESGTTSRLLTKRASKLCGPHVRAHATTPTNTTR
jgi:hypothetical protein